MADDDLQITHLVVPKKWIVAAIGAVMSAMLTAGGTFYKYGSLAGRLAELEKHCLTQEAPVSARISVKPKQ